MSKWEELNTLAQAVKGWGNCDKAWYDNSEDEPAAVVGHISDEGTTYPVATVDCDQYLQAQDSLKLARFYAAANPSAILELLAERDALKAENERLLAANRDCMLHYEDAQAELERIRAMEPVAWANPCGGFLSDSYMKHFALGLEKQTHTIPLYSLEKS